jgi:hypothetical protein
MGTGVCEIMRQTKAGKMQRAKAKERNGDGAVGDAGLDTLSTTMPDAMLPRSFPVVGQTNLPQHQHHAFPRIAGANSHLQLSNIISYPPGAFTSSLVKGRACHFGGSRRCSTMTFILSPMLVESTASSAADHIRRSRLHVTVTPAISRVTLSAEHLQLLGFRQSTTCRIYALTIRVLTRYLASSIALHQNRHDRVVFAHHKIFLTPSAFLAKPPTFFNIPTPRARFASDLTSDQVVQLATGTAFRHAVARRRLHPRTQPS